MVSRGLLVCTIGVVFAGGASAADQANSSVKGSISRGAVAGILIALACTLTLSLLLLERRRKRKLGTNRAWMEGRAPPASLPSRRPSTQCHDQPWRISPSSRRDGDPTLFAPMEIVAPPPTYDAALRDKRPPCYKASSSVISAAKSEPSIATRNQEGSNPC